MSQRACCPPCTGECNQGRQCPAQAIVVPPEFVEPPFLDFSFRELTIGAVIVAATCSAYVFRDWLVWVLA